MTPSKVVGEKPKQLEFEFTEAHRYHLEQIKLATCDLLDRKYKAGGSSLQGNETLEYAVGKAC